MNDDLFSPATISATDNLDWLFELEKMRHIVLTHDQDLKSCLNLDIKD